MTKEVSNNIFDVLFERTEDNADPYPINQIEKRCKKLKRYWEENIESIFDEMLKQGSRLSMAIQSCNTNASYKYGIEVSVSKVIILSSDYETYTISIQSNGPKEIYIRIDYTPTVIIESYYTEISEILLYSLTIIELDIIEKWAKRVNELSLTISESRFTNQRTSWKIRGEEDD